MVNLTAPHRVAVDAHCLVGPQARTMPGVRGWPAPYERNESPVVGHSRLGGLGRARREQRRRHWDARRIHRRASLLLQTAGEMRCEQNGQSPASGQGRANTRKEAGLRGLIVSSSNACRRQRQCGVASAIQQNRQLTSERGGAAAAGCRVCKAQSPRSALSHSSGSVVAQQKDQHNQPLTLL